MLRLMGFRVFVAMGLLLPMFVENASATAERKCAPFKTQYHFLLAPEPLRTVDQVYEDTTDQRDFMPIQLEMTSSLVQQGCVSEIVEAAAPVESARIKLDGEWLEVPAACLTSLKMFPRKIALDGYGDSFSLSFDIQGKYAVLDRMEYTISYERDAERFTCKRWDW